MTSTAMLVSAMSAIPLCICLCIVSSHAVSPELCRLVAGTLIRSLKHRSVTHDCLMRQYPAMPCAALQYPLIISCLSFVLFDSLPNLTLLTAENLLIHRDMVKIADFGLAREIRSRPPSQTMYLLAGTERRKCCSGRSTTVRPLTCLQWVPSCRAFHAEAFVSWQLRG